jgi:hypothetical protein
MELFFPKDEPKYKLLIRSTLRRNIMDGDVGRCGGISSQRASVASYCKRFP